MPVCLDFKIIMTLDPYRRIIRPIIFSGLKLDPEWAHLQALKLLEQIGSSSHASIHPLVKTVMDTTCTCEDERLTQSLWGLSFTNPVGLAAGFDKDGVAASVWSSLGFGFAELGTVTQHPQPGNPKPRLFRLTADQAVLNRMGFNNQGAETLAMRLTDLYAQKAIGIPLGINLGKSKITPLDQAVEDYLASFQLLQAVGDYFVVNVSSPNTPGLRSLQAIEQLRPILAALQSVNQPPKPLLLKISPDLDWEEIAEIVQLAQACQLSGIIATNTTIDRNGLKTALIKATGKSVSQEAGGISGQPLKQRSTDVIRFIYQQTQGTLPIIGVGGVFTADDAWEKITAGATLIQIYTGWIYEGPWMVRRIIKGLQQKLDANHLTRMSDAIGMQS